MMKKVIVLLLALLLLCPLAFSCAKPSDNSSDDTTLPANQSDDGGNGTTSVVETTVQYPEPAAVDYSGYTYRMLVTSNELWIPLYYSEIGKENGNAINDALFRRETLIEDLFKCEIDVIIDKDAKTSLMTAEASGDEICDIIMLTGVDTMNAAKSGQLYDLNTISELQLENPWWDQRIQKEYLIGDKLFCVEGDYCVREDLRTMTLIYNKEVYKANGYNEKYGDPYKMVSEHTWTYAKMVEMIDGLSHDLDGVDGMGRNDFWGMLSENSAPYYFYLGSGTKTIINKDGVLSLNIIDDSSYERIINCLQDTMKLASSPDVLIANNGRILDSSTVWTDAVEMFTEDKCLFRSTTLSSVNGFTDMKSDYGILPVPAYYDDQQEYYCYVSGSNHTPLAIQNSAKDITRTATITEALAYHSMFSGLTHAFYEQLALARLARSENDKLMLDLIFTSKTYDIDQTCSLSGFEPIIYSMAKAGNADTLSSNLGSIRGNSQKILNRYIETFNKNNQ